MAFSKQITSVKFDFYNTSTVASVASTTLSVNGIDFTKKMEALVANYNDRSENDVLRSEVYDEMAEALTDMIMQVRDEFDSGDELGIDFEAHQNQQHLTIDVG